MRQISVFLAAMQYCLPRCTRNNMRNTSKSNISSKQKPFVAHISSSDVDKKKLPRIELFRGTVSNRHLEKIDADSGLWEVK